LNSKEEFIELMKLRAVKNEILDSPCTCIYVKLFLRNKFCKKLIINPINY